MKRNLPQLPAKGYMMEFERRVIRIMKRALNFHEFISLKKPEEVEEFYQKYPNTAGARERLYSMYFTKAIPSKFIVKHEHEITESERMTTQDLVKMLKEMEVPVEQLKQIAGEDDALP